MNSLQVRLYLDAIEEKISRMEPRLEQMQAAPSFETQPLAPPAERKAPPLAAETPIRTSPTTPTPDLQPEIRSSLPALAESTTDRRRRLHDLPNHPVDRRRPPFAPPDTSVEKAPRSPQAWLLAHRAESALAASAAVALLGIFLFGGTHKGAPVPPAVGSGTAAVTSTPVLPAARPSAGTPLPSAHGSETSSSSHFLNASRASNPSEPQPDPQPNTSLSAANADAASPLTSSPSDASLSDRASSYPLTFVPVPSRSTASGRSLPSTRVQVSSGVMAGNLLASHPPKYPGGVASLLHPEGKVTMQAVISKSGRVENLHVLSGHFLLRSAARSAVQTWRYRPFYVNGNPVEVATIVSVEFHR